MTQPEPDNSNLPTAQAKTFKVLNHRVRYPDAYTWLLLMSALDVMMTWTIFHFKGVEANPIADWIIKRYELNGMIIYKFALITFFISVCEIVGSLREKTGRKLSRLGVMIASIPVIWSFVLLAKLAFH